MDGYRSPNLLLAISCSLLPDYRRGDKPLKEPCKRPYIIKLCMSLCMCVSVIIIKPTGYWLGRCLSWAPLFQFLCMLPVGFGSLLLWNAPYTLLYFMDLPWFDRYLLQPKRSQREWTAARFLRALLGASTNLATMYTLAFLASPLICAVR